jgi:hypothetical protein
VIVIMTRKTLFSLLFSFIALRLLRAAPNKDEFYKTVPAYFRQCGFLSWWSIPSGRYTVPIDKYAAYDVLINQSGNESDESNCQLTVTYTDLRYFGGFLENL